MSIAIVCPGLDAGKWAASLRAVDPALNVQVWPDISDPDEVVFALCWDQPPGALRRFPNLKCISSIGAGVEHLLTDETIPPGVAVVRLVDDDLKQSMAEYVMLGVLDHVRRFGDYRRQQKRAEWKKLGVPHVSKIWIGIMGFGEIGGYVGRRLSDFGFRVCGWTRTPKKSGHIKVYSGADTLEAFLSRSGVLVCLLPLTPETEGILNARTFDSLPAGAYLINAGRGGHLVEDDLLSALDSGQLSGALLDVFEEEPLPQNHPFWGHEKITVTPHVASITRAASASVQVVDNYRRALGNEPLLNPADRESGY